jgi:uncharacterized surface protein with fasciclin (FAS1) repeats
MPSPKQRSQQTAYYVTIANKTQIVHFLVLQLSILTMFRFSSFFLASLAVPVFAVLGAQTSRQLQTMAPETVDDIILASDSLSTLAAALTAAGFVNAPALAALIRTVFAPENEAFGALPAVFFSQHFRPRDSTSTSRIS